ncbi:MAG: hypothetical protein K2N38_01475 [Oscillospiraceae bacterium]|nr:hypothetical protein [Oscillospiraceae bacterium]
MYSLEKTSDRGVLKICFDSLLTESRLGPFADILAEYAAESGLMPRRIDILFNYAFIEKGSKIQFYWNGGFTVYVFGIESTQSQTVYERLLRITERLNNKKG